MSGSLSTSISDILLAVGVRIGLARDHSLPLSLITGHNGTPPRIDHSLPLSLRAGRNGTSSGIDHSLAVSLSSPTKLNCLGLAKIEGDLLCGSRLVLLVVMLIRGREEYLVDSCNAELANPVAPISVMW